MSVMVEAWGRYACFSRPELKVERMSYDVMTPSAARGLLEAIYWHPGFKWVVDRIYVLAPIRFTSIRRNEVKSTIIASNVKRAMSGGGGSLFISTADDIQQRAATALQDVRYVIQAHFVMTERAGSEDNEGKFCDIMRRRLEKGQCYHQPCFGVREFPAAFRAWEGGKIEAASFNEDRELGPMLYDMDFSDPGNILPTFFRASLKGGVMEVPAPESEEVLR